jgi:hypothetical protein
VGMLLKMSRADMFASVSLVQEAGCVLDK